MKTQKTIGTVKMFRVLWSVLMFVTVLLVGPHNVGATEIPSTTSPANDLALNTTRSGYPSPLESDDGWGGGSSKWDLVDGLRTYPEWAHGLAFMKGWHQVTIDFGSPVTFNTVIAWWHNGGVGCNGAPQAYYIESWNGSNWDVIVPTTSPNYKYPDATDWWSGWSAPTEDIFSPVTARKVRLWSLPKDGEVGAGYHTWLYEVEVTPEPATMLLLGLGGLAMLRRRRMN